MPLPTPQPQRHSPFRLITSSHYHLITLLTTLALVPLASAADYYISPTGNDNNPGSQAQPWGTLAKVSDIGGPGDTIYLRAGTYTPSKNIYFYKDGSATAPLTCRAYPGESVLIDGTNLPANTEAIYISSSYFVFQDIEIANSKANGITLDAGQNKTGAGFTTIRNCKIHGSTLSGIYVSGGHDCLIDNCTVYNNAGINNGHPAGVTWPGALSAKGSPNTTVTNCNIYNNQGEGLIFYLTDNCRASGNVVHDNFSVNMYLDNARNCVLDGNFIYTQGDAAYLHNGAPASGIQHANETYNGANAPNYSSDNQVINNVIVVLNNNFGFLYSNYNGQGGGLKNFLFANNTVYRKVTASTGTCALLAIDPGLPQANDNAIFRNNIFVTESGTLLDISVNTGLTFDHNLFFGGTPNLAAATDLIVNPNFTNAGTYKASDYLPQASSPVFGAGIAIPQVTKDFNGASRAGSNDLGAFVKDSTPTTPPPPPNQKGPAFNSPPTVTPNPAAPNVAISFTAAATSTLPLTYTWDFGDGSSLKGASVSKSYSTPGTYSCRCTASDGTNSTSQDFTTTIQGSTFDSTNATVRLNSRRANYDTLLITGSIELSNGLDIADDPSASITLGSFNRQMTLNLRGASTDRSFKILARFAKGDLAAGSYPFTFTAKRMSLTDLANTTTAPLTLQVGPYTFTAPQSLTVYK